MAGKVSIPWAGRLDALSSVDDEELIAGATAAAQVVADRARDVQPEAYYAGNRVIHALAELANIVRRRT